MKKTINVLILFFLLSFPFIHTSETRKNYIAQDQQDEYAIFTTQITSDTFLRSTSNIALLNHDNNFDQAAFVQSIIDLESSIKSPKNSTKRTIELNLAGRINTVWGSPETLETVTPSIIKIGHSVTETDHAHAVNKPILSIKSSWMKIYSESKKSWFQCGLFPKQIGLGLILGNGYKMGNPLLTNDSEVFIDQYRPGIMFETEIKKNHSISGYCGFEKIYSTSIDQQMGLFRSQELQETSQARYIKKDREPFQNTFLLSLEGQSHIFERTVLQKRSLTISPFILYKNDPNQTVEFFGDAESKIFTAGFSSNFSYRNFFGTLDFAVQGGHQKVKAWDRNISLADGTKTLTHLFYEKTTAPSAYALSTFFPSQQDVSLNYPAGTIFSAFQPDGITAQNFQNSWSRFRKAYTNSLSGFLLAFDGGYNYNDKITFGAIAGMISGDENSNDTTEKVMLYRYSPTWDSVRKDKNNEYFGFQGTDSLYSGRAVHSHYLLRSNRLANNLNTEPELTANSCSNLLYFGLSTKYNKKILSKNRSFFIQPNIIFMLQTHKTTFGYDPTIVDTYDPISILPTNLKFASAETQLPRSLGLEINTNVHFYDNDNFALHGSFACFIPGAYYNKIREISYNKQGRTIPLKNQYQGELANMSGIETNEQNVVTLLNNISMNFQLGFSIHFDFLSEFFNARSAQKNHRKNIVVHPFIKKKSH
jgi:hypothetical protein